MGAGPVAHQGRRPVTRIQPYTPDRHGTAASAGRPGDGAAARYGRSTRRSNRVVSSVIVLAVIVVVVFALSVVGGAKGGQPPTAHTPPPVPTAPASSMTPLQARIVSIAVGQVGYATNPPDTYCNKYSAYWVSGNADCGNSNMSEEWCADFAAWVWKSAGATVDYQYINGDLNSSAASFYEWGVQQGTWHPIGDGYTAQPGDVAVYGLDAPALVAQHVAIVTGQRSGEAGPDVVNGDGDHHGYSVVEAGEDQLVADIPNGSAARLSGYVSPVAS
jgi:hypothetical protein